MRSDSFSAPSHTTLRAVFESYGEYDFPDFNCGLPVPKVLKQNAGFFWLRKPEEMIELLSETVKISKKTILVKIRLGFDYRIHGKLDYRKHRFGYVPLGIRRKNDFFSIRNALAGFYGAC